MLHKQGKDKIINTIIFLFMDKNKFVVIWFDKSKIYI